MNNLPKPTWLITPSELLASELRKQQLNAINLSHWQKIFYRNILHGQKQIISDYQQQFIIKQLNPDFSNTEITTFCYKWRKLQENCNQDPEFVAYQNYITKNQLTDKHCLWQDIILATRIKSIKLIFYGFAEIKPNIEQLIQHLRQYISIEVFYPISNRAEISAVQHTSAASELEWLRRFPHTGKTLIICPKPDKIIPLQHLAKAKCTTSTTLASTFIAQQAITTLTAVNTSNNFTKEYWLPVICQNFPNSQSILAWRQSNNFKLTTSELEQLLISNREPEIWHWLIKLTSIEIPKLATFAEWYKIVNSILTLLPNTHAANSLNFWHTTLTKWGQQDLKNTKQVSFDQAITDLAYKISITKFKNHNNDTSEVIVASVDEAAGIIPDTLIIIDANNELVPNQAEQYFIRWQYQAQQVIYSKADDLTATSVFAPIQNIPATPIKITSNEERISHWRPFIETIVRNEPLTISNKMLTEQALCPIKAAFNSLCKHKVENTQNQSINLIRGIVCHDVLAKFWQETKDLTTLNQFSKSALTQKIQQLLATSLAKQEHNVKYQFSLKIEQEHLSKIILKFLDAERTRDEFKILHIEHKRNIRILNYNINVRLDRVDLEPDGLHLIDYKTGNSSPNITQMLLYISDSEMPYTNASYAQINKNDNKLKQIKDKNMDWPTFVAQAKSSVEQLVQDLITNESTTQPIEPQICDNCNLQGICRPNDTLYRVF